MKFISSHKKLIGSIIITSVMFFVSYFNMLSFLEYRLEDWLFQNPGFTSPEIVVIGIDEFTLAELGQFQDWSRGKMAEAINILNQDEEYKPAVIALDILYVSESTTPEVDEALVKAAADGGNVVVASQAAFGDDMSLNRIVKYVDFPFTELQKVTANGLANGTYDEDGVIRNALLSTQWNGETIYSFPHEIYKKYTGSEPYDITETYISYSGRPGDFTQGVSFVDIFAEDFDPSFFADCVVFIGPYAPGMMDAYFTPVAHDVQMYGVEIHANVLQALLEENFKSRITPQLRHVILIAVLLIGLALCEIDDIRILLLLILTVCASYIAMALWVFNKGYLLSMLYPVLSLTVLYVYRLIYGYVLETLEKQRVKSVFKKYVDPKLVDKLVETGEAQSNDVGMKKDIAVLFVDIRGFTPMTEALKDEPEMVVKILNEYLELTSSSVFNNGGSVDKFIGDATMALFNGFVPLDDFEYKAVKAAWDMVQGAVSVNASIKEKYGVDVGFGVGVHCGEAIVGNLGPSFRKDYTAIGDTVNTAARLESNSKRSQVLISKQLYDLVKDRVNAESIGEIPLKGKSIKLEIFSVTNVLDVPA